MIKPKKIVREKLYYGKYKYRLNVTMDELRWFYPFWWRGTGTFTQSSVSPNALVIVKSLVDFMKKYRTKKYSHKAEVRKSHVAFTVYTNDLKVTQELYDIIEEKDNFDKVKTEFTEVDDLVPQGVKYFVKKPPGNYRVYFKNIYGADLSLKHDLGDFFNRSESFRPSKLLKRTLYDDRFNFRYFWVEKNHYFDCDNEADISYFMLMYPELVRMTYKLEQKPDSVAI